MNSKTAITTLSIVVILLAGTSIYFAVKNSQKEAPITQEQSTQQTETQEPSAQPQTTQTTQQLPIEQQPTSQPDNENRPNPPQAEEIKYVNRKYGFELTFPGTWQGFNATNRTINWGKSGSGDSLDFGLPAQKDGLFNISIFSIKQWNALKNTPGAPTYITESKNYVFGWNQAQYAANQEIEKRMTEIKDIIKSFKLI